MVAPNSPIDLAKHRMAPAITPGRQSGRVTVANTQNGLAPKRAGRRFQPHVDRLDREANGAHQQRKAHDRAGQRRAGPAEGEDDAEGLVEEGADRPALAERDQQQVAGDDRRHDQRQVDQRVEQALAPELAARQQPGDGDAEGQAGQGRRGGDQQAQPDRRPFLRRHVEEADFTRTREALLLERRCAPWRCAGSRGRPWRRRSSIRGRARRDR